MSTSTSTTTELVYNDVIVFAKAVSAQATRSADIGFVFQRGKVLHSMDDFVRDEPYANVQAYSHPEIACEYDHMKDIQPDDFMIVRDYEKTNDLTKKNYVNSRGFPDFCILFFNITRNPHDISLLKDVFGDYILFKHVEDNYPELDDILVYMDRPVQREIVSHAPLK